MDKLLVPEIFQLGGLAVVCLCLIGFAWWLAKQVFETTNQFNKTLQEHSSVLDKQNQLNEKLLDVVRGNIQRGNHSFALAVVFSGVLLTSCTNTACKVAAKSDILKTGGQGFVAPNATISHDCSYTYYKSK